MKSYVKEMIRMLPAANRADLEVLADCIQQCLECAATCTAASVISSSDPAMASQPCVRLTQASAEICQTTAKVMLRLADRENPVIRKQLQACAIACESCGDACEVRAARHEHCRICADACHRTAELCNHVLTGQAVV